MTKKWIDYYTTDNGEIIAYIFEFADGKRIRTDKKVYNSVEEIKENCEVFKIGEVRYYLNGLRRDLGLFKRMAEIDDEAEEIKVLNNGVDILIGRYTVSARMGDVWGA